MQWRSDWGTWPPKFVAKYFPFEVGQVGPAEQSTRIVGPFLNGDFRLHWDSGPPHHVGIHIDFPLDPFKWWVCCGMQALNTRISAYTPCLFLGDNCDEGAWERQCHGNCWVVRCHSYTPRMACESGFLRWNADQIPEYTPVQPREVDFAPLVGYEDVTQAAWRGCHAPPICSREEGSGAPGEQDGMTRGEGGGGYGAMDGSDALAQT